ncbi:MAG: hypothetical protein ABIK28_10415 [Planctomycetota bacterium]
MLKTFCAVVLISCSSIFSASAYQYCGTILADSDDGTELDDGTEVNRSIWYEDGLDYQYNYLGTDNFYSYLAGIRFSVPDLNQGEEIAYARLRFSSGGGEVTHAVNMLIEGVLQENPTTFSPESRPSQKGPKTSRKVLWTIDESWHSRNYTFFHYHSPDISSIVNEILSLPDWGSENKSLIIVLNSQYAVQANDYVLFTDFGGTNKGETLIELYKTVYETFLGKEMIARVSDNSATISMYSLIETDVYIEYGREPGLYTFSSGEYRHNPPETPIEVVLTNLEPDTQYYYRLSYRRAGKGPYQHAEEGHFHTQRKRGSEFSFALHSDEHLTGKHYSVNPLQMNDVALYKVALGNIENAGYDFLLSLGDLVVNEGLGKNVLSIDEAKRNYIVQREYYYNEALHSLPFYFVLGNHEGEQGWYYKPDEPDKNKAVMNAMARKELIPNPYPDLFYSGNSEPVQEYGMNEDYYSWEWGDALFVVLSPFHSTKEKPQDTYDGWDWTFGKDQYDWLYDTLHGSEANWKFIFTHHLTTTTTVAEGNALTHYGRGGIEVAKFKVAQWPSFEWGGEDDSGDIVFDEKRPGWEQGPIHDFLVSEKVTAVFHGHDHLFAKQDLDGIVYQECPVPDDSLYGIGFRKQGLYEYGTVLNNSGHIQVRVNPELVQVDYVRAYLPGDGPNGHIEYTYIIEETAPKIAQIHPLSHSCNNPINTSIDLQFTDEQSGINASTISIQLDTDPAILNGKFLPGFEGSITPIENGCRVRIDPQANFEKRSKVRVFYKASDNANIPNWIQGQYSFQTSSFAAEAAHRKS